MSPDLEKCRSLMVDYGMLSNIKAHSLMVARVAVCLSWGLNRAGLFVDDEQVLAGALLHDIAKTKCLYGKCNHAKIGAEICLELGYPDLAEIVGQHVILADYNPVKITALQLVYYADKRVQHDGIVNLVDRRDDIIVRYGRKDPLIIADIELNFGRCQQIEEMIFADLDFVASELATEVSGQDLGF